MPDIYIAAIVAGSALAVLSGACAAGWTANNAPEIAASWREGCKQLAEWRTALAAAWRRFRARARRVHGRHRAGVA